MATYSVMVTRQDIRLGCRGNVGGPCPVARAIRRTTKDARWGVGWSAASAVGVGSHLRAVLPKKVTRFITRFDCIGVPERPKSQFSPFSFRLRVRDAAEVA